MLSTQHAKSWSPVCSPPRCFPTFLQSASACWTWRETRSSYRAWGWRSRSWQSACSTRCTKTYLFVWSHREESKTMSLNLFTGDYWHRSGASLQEGGCHPPSRWRWARWRKWGWGSKEEEGKGDLRALQRIRATDRCNSQGDGEGDRVRRLVSQPEVLASCGQCTLHRQPPVYRCCSSTGKRSQGCTWEEDENEAVRYLVWIGWLMFMLHFSTSPWNKRRINSYVFSFCRYYRCNSVGKYQRYFLHWPAEGKSFQPWWANHRTSFLFPATSKHFSWQVCYHGNIKTLICIFFSALLILQTPCEVSLESWRWLFPGALDLPHW